MPEMEKLTVNLNAVDLVNKVITFTDRFKAASSGAGVANWISLFGEGDVAVRSLSGRLGRPSCSSRSRTGPGRSASSSMRSKNGQTWISFAQPGFQGCTLR